MAASTTSPQTGVILAVGVAAIASIIWFVNVQLKNYMKAAEWSRKWLESHPADENMNVLLAQSYYLIGDYENTAAVMAALIEDFERAGRVPAQSQFALLLSAYQKTRNEDAARNTFEKMRRHYPDPR